VQGYARAGIKGTGGRGFFTAAIRDFIFPAVIDVDSERRGTGQLNPRGVPCVSRPRRGPNNN